ncbi:MAG: glycosyltransferase family 39 protein [Bacteroidales bacterium]|nr:glycosyltransferase family 39 protein [Bacteroidales bacterium]
MGIKFSEKNLKIVGYILLAGLIYLPIFGHLENLPIRIWDEARLAVNAYEMYKNGNWVVTYFNGQPEMWNTKPPLMIWLQSLGMHIFGPGELAVRLPSAIATFLLFIGLLYFNEKYIKNFWFGVFTILVLVTSNGFINLHASRTGDYDALLTLFTTLFGLSFFYYLETEKNKVLYLSFIFITLAVLTKSIQGLLFLPGLFIFTLIHRKLLVLLKNKHFYFGILLFVMVVAGYYLLRESVNPGYLEAVYFNELGGRYLESLEGHNEPFWFFYDHIRLYYYKEWLWFLPLGLITGLLVHKREIRRLTLFSAILIVSYFLIISASQTKLYWYDVPMYPFMAIICAVFIFYVFSFVKDKVRVRKAWINPLILLILIVSVYYEPYRKIIKKTYTPQVYSWEKEDYEIEYLLRDAIRGKYDLSNYLILHKNYNVHLMFYMNILNDEGRNIRFAKAEDIKPGDTIVIHQEEMKNFVEAHYNFEDLYTRKNVKIYKIDGRK